MCYLASIDTWWRIDNNMTNGARFQIFQKRLFMKECRHLQANVSLYLGFGVADFELSFEADPGTQS